MHVVVVVDERDHDAAGAVQGQVRSDEHVLRAGRDEAVDQVLGRRDIHVGRELGRALAEVHARIEDVSVEAVLMRRMAEAAVARAERPTVRA